MDYQQEELMCFIIISKLFDVLKVNFIRVRRRHLDKIFEYLPEITTALWGLFAGILLEKS